MENQFQFSSPEEFKHIKERILALPAEVKAAELALAEASDSLEREKLILKVQNSGHYLKAQGKTVDEKKAQVQQLVEAQERVVLDKELAMLKAKAAYNEKDKEFDAARKVANMLETAINKGL